MKSLQYLLILQLGTIEYMMVTVISHLIRCDNMSQNETAEQQNMATQWPDLLGQLFDRMTGKEAIITYSFRGLEVEIPRAAGPRGQSLGSAKWVLNGDLVIKAQSHSQGSGGIER